MSANIFLFLETFILESTLSIYSNLLCFLLCSLMIGISLSVSKWIEKLVDKKMKLINTARQNSEKNCERQPECEWCNILTCSAQFTLTCAGGHNIALQDLTYMESIEEGCALTGMPVRGLLPVNEIKTRFIQIPYNSEDGLSNIALYDDVESNSTTWPYPLQQLNVDPYIGAYGFKHNETFLKDDNFLNIYSNITNVPPNCTRFVNETIRGTVNTYEMDFIIGCIDKTNYIYCDPHRPVGLKLCEIMKNRAKFYMFYTHAKDLIKLRQRLDSELKSVQDSLETLNIDIDALEDLEYRSDVGRAFIDSLTSIQPARPSFYAAMWSFNHVETGHLTIEEAKKAAGDEVLKAKLKVNIATTIGMVSGYTALETQVNIMQAQEAKRTLGRTDTRGQYRTLLNRYNAVQKELEIFDHDFYKITGKIQEYLFNYDQSLEKMRDHVMNPNPCGGQYMGPNQVLEADCDISKVPNWKRKNDTASLPGYREDRFSKENDPCWTTTDRMLLDNKAECEYYLKVHTTFAQSKVLTSDSNHPYGCSIDNTDNTIYFRKWDSIITNSGTIDEKKILLNFNGGVSFEYVCKTRTGEFLSAAETKKMTNSNSAVLFSKFYSIDKLHISKLSDCNEQLNWYSNSMGKCIKGNDNGYNFFVLLYKEVSIDAKGYHTDHIIGTGTASEFDDLVLTSQDYTTLKFQMGNTKNLNMSHTQLKSLTGPGVIENSTFQKFKIISNIEDITFKNCDLSGAQFLGTMTNVTFDNCNIDDVEFHANVVGVTIKGGSSTSICNMDIRNMYSSHLAYGVDLSFEKSDDDEYIRGCTSYCNTIGDSIHDNVTNFKYLCTKGQFIVSPHISMEGYVLDQIKQLHIIPKDSTFVGWGKRLLICPSKSQMDNLENVTCDTKYPQLMKTFNISNFQETLSVAKFDLQKYNFGNVVKYPMMKYVLRGDVKKWSTRGVSGALKSCPNNLPYDYSCIQGKEGYHIIGTGVHLDKAKFSLDTMFSINTNLQHISGTVQLDADNSNLVVLHRDYTLIKTEGTEETSYALVGPYTNNNGITFTNIVQEDCGYFSGYYGQITAPNNKCTTHNNIILTPSAFAFQYKTMDDQRNPESKITTITDADNIDLSYADLTNGYFHNSNLCRVKNLDCYGKDCSRDNMFIRGLLLKKQGECVKYSWTTDVVYDSEYGNSWRCLDTPTGLYKPDVPEGDLFQTWWSRGPSVDGDLRISSNTWSWSDDSAVQGQYLDGSDDNWANRNVRCNNINVTGAAIALDLTSVNNAWNQGRVFATRQSEDDEDIVLYGLTEQWTTNVLDINTPIWPDVNMWFPGILGTADKHMFVYHYPPCIHSPNREYLDQRSEDYHITYGKAVNPLYMYFHNIEILQPKQYIANVDNTTYPDISTGRYDVTAEQYTQTPEHGDRRWRDYDNHDANQMYRTCRDIFFPNNRRKPCSLRGEGVDFSDIHFKNNDTRKRALEWPMYKNPDVFPLASETAYGYIPVYKYPGALERCPSDTDINWGLAPRSQPGGSICVTPTGRDTPYFFGPEIVIDQKFMECTLVDKSFTTKDKLHVWSSAIDVNRDVDLDLETEISDIGHFVENHLKITGLFDANETIEYFNDDKTKRREYYPHHHKAKRYSRVETEHKNRQVSFTGCTLLSDEKSLEIASKQFTTVFKTYDPVTKQQRPVRCEFDNDNDDETKALIFASVIPDDQTAFMNIPWTRCSYLQTKTETAKIKEKLQRCFDNNKNKMSQNCTDSSYRKTKEDAKKSEYCSTDTNNCLPYETSWIFEPGIPYYREYEQASEKIYIPYAPEFHGIDLTGVDMKNADISNIKLTETFEGLYNCPKSLPLGYVCEQMAQDNPHDNIMYPAPCREMESIVGKTLNKTLLYATNGSNNPYNTWEPEYEDHAPWKYNNIAWTLHDISWKNIAITDEFASTWATIYPHECKYGGTCTNSDGPILNGNRRLNQQNCEAAKGEWRGYYCHTNETETSMFLTKYDCESKPGTWTPRNNSFCYDVSTYIDKFEFEDDASMNQDQSIQALQTHFAWKYLHQEYQKTRNVTQNITSYVTDSLIEYHCGAGKYGDSGVCQDCPNGWYSSKLTFNTVCETHTDIKSCEEMVLQGTTTHDSIGIRCS